MQNYLDYISIKGFRSIRAIEKLELRPINILIGANGSGKSNFVEVFSFLNAIRRGRLQAYTAERGGADTILHFGSKVTPEISFKISFNDGINGSEILLKTTDKDEFYVDSEFWFPNKRLEPPLYKIEEASHEAGVSRTNIQFYPSLAHQQIDSWRIYHFNDTSQQSPIKRMLDINDNQFLRPDGSNLPAYLLLLKEKQPFEYSLIRDVTRTIAPFLDDFQLAPSRRNENKIRLEWIHKYSDKYFDVSSLSDGTIRFICLATLLLQPVQERPSLILLDEPELGLHPYAISMLASMVKSAATETQIIISTQSPLLLDRFEPEDILVTELEDGATTLTRLQSSDLEEWLEDYSFGQLWEKNHFGGVPKHG